MEITETYEIELCPDCMSWHANGDTTGIDDPEREAEVRSQSGIDDGWIVSVGHLHTIDQCGYDAYQGNTDCPYDEPSFSWSRCDSCRSPLGGDRYPASMFHPRVSA